MRGLTPSARSVPAGFCAAGPWTHRQIGTVLEAIAHTTHEPQRAAVPAQMRGLILEKPGVISLTNIPVPEPAAGEVLVRVMAATTCGTDLKAYLRGHPQIPMPGVFGHEYSGVVASVGEGAPFAVGDPVMGVHSAPCRKCRWCVRGQENLCQSIMATKVLGSYAEYLLVPAHIARINLFPKPEGLSFEAASLLEPLSCVAQGLESVPNHVGDRVLIIGPGAIGLMFAAALRLRGSHEIVLAGRNKERLAVGESFGAKTAHPDDPSLDRQFDVVIECTGSVDVWQRSVSYARKGGTVVLFGGCPSGSSASFDTGRLHYDQITLISPFHFGTAAVQTAREWLLDPTMDLLPLISESRALEEGRETFEDLKAGHGLKYVFHP